MSWSLRWAAGLLAVLAVIVAVDNLGRPLANPDEGRYSEISRAMLESGDWITPRLNGFKYLEKPPLQYWATATSFALFGINEYSARFYVAACGLLSILAMGFASFRLLGPAVGAGVVLALLSSPYFLAMDGVVTLDAGLTAWTTVGLAAFLLALHESDARLTRRWVLLAWAATGLAVLSKGLVGMLLPAASVALYALVHRDASVLRRLEWIRGPLLALAITVPWFVAAERANPGFAHFFFIHEHFTRFVTEAHGRAEPAWYFLPIIFLGFLPWLAALVPAALHAWRGEAAQAGFKPLRFALIWSAFIVAFFSSSGSKLPGYVLPAFPALALVLGAFLARAPEKRLAAWLLPALGVVLVLGVLAWLVPERARDPWMRALYLEARPYALAGIAMMFVLCTGAALLLARGKRWLGLIGVALASVLLADCLSDAYEKFSPRQSGKAIAQLIRERATPQTRLYSVSFYDQSVTFYVGRPFTLVQYVDEFAFGMRAEPGRAYDRLDQFPALWAAPGPAMAIMQPGIRDRFAASGVDLRTLHEDPRRVLVTKP